MQVIRVYSELYTGKLDKEVLVHWCLGFSFYSPVSLFGQVLDAADRTSYIDDVFALAR